MIDVKSGLPELLFPAIGFAPCAHRTQKRKYTGEPYVNHCQSVAVILSRYTCDVDVLKAAILHDAVEDTDVTAGEITEVFSERVAALVLEVTDPAVGGNRDFRKRIAREHVARSSPEGATIKLADLIDNTQTIVPYDQNFGRIYLAEKELLLEVLKHGNADLWQRAYETLQEGQRQLIHASLEKASV
jgi:(p)ppGpp synthase/HD superfamily hydrolase